LNEGLEISLIDHRASQQRGDVFRYSEGVVDLLRPLYKSVEALHSPPFHVKERGPVEFEAALQWTTATTEQIRVYANDQWTPAGGTHLTGLRTAINCTISGLLDAIGVTRGDLCGEDCREGLAAVLATE